MLRTCILVSRFRATWSLMINRPYDGLKKVKWDAQMSRPDLLDARFAEAGSKKTDKYEISSHYAHAYN